MNFSWTPHRFAGGALALDVANSVILRFDPARSIDRFADPSQIDAFVRAAAQFSAERVLFGPLAPVTPQACAAFLRFREAIDRHFRAEAEGKAAPHHLADLLEQAALLLRLVPDAGGLEVQTVHSALRLIALPEPERLKICGHCGWLFLDRSKNKSRFWCDMAVCGNRAKAARHYRRKKGEPE
ncbi:CGNR zinc finger domain-containing protein [Rhizobium sp. CSW-27]|uniref:CGNR zinc finger domain-containing protein n=1 Tax=Rhizobium sp. CSW-27 TaxID=2839985 RepID=UPI001C0361E0|nr:CGNR zinc finger domain-containing protein [Rhizobium sp. CSW-27]MBT9368435.1 CGNR zinc finger domain-containing protein [Rhizobium sp. CSW-27]